MVKEFRLDGRVALITGAGRGIGTGIAEVFAAAGAGLAANARTSEYLEPLVRRLAEEHGVQAAAFPADVTDPQAVIDLVARVVDEFGRIDVLVNNLGDAIQAPLVPLPDRPEAGALSNEDIQTILDLNIMSAIHCTRAVGEQMLGRRSGKVINISGYAGVRGRPNQTIYSAAKAALVGLTRSLALEWAPYNVQVNVIAPGMFPDQTTVGEAAYRAAQESARTRVPLGRVGELRDVGLLSLYLAGEASDYMTGQVLPLDGGQTA